MTDVPQGGKGLGKGRLALVAVAVFAASGVAIYLQNREKKKQAIAAAVWQIEHGDEIQSSTAIRSLHLQLTTPAEFLEILPYLVHKMDDESVVVREAAVTFVGQWILHFGSTGLKLTKEREPTIIQLCRKAQDVVLPHLDDSSPAVRTSVANSLTSIARVGDLEVPPPQLVAALEDEAETVRIASSQALSNYWQGPKALLPVALRRLPTESPLVATSMARDLGGVNPEPSLLPALIEGLSSEDPNVRYIAVTAISNMGTAGSPALPAILALLRKEIDAPQPGPVKGVGPMFVEDITERAAGAVGQICPDGGPPPEAVEALREVLKRPNEAAQLSAAGSLGILGPKAAAAVPQLLAIFEAPKQSRENRDLLAKALAQITRGTADEDRAIAAIATAWKATAPKEKAPLGYYDFKGTLAAVLQSFGPKAQRLVPELKGLPASKTDVSLHRR